MNVLVKIVAPLLVATVVLSGCTLTRGSHLVIGSTRAPTNAADVRIYTELPAKYEKIAMVSADSRNDFASQQNLSDHALERLKEEAAKVGANGILLNGFGNYVVGSSGVVNVLQTGPHTAFGVGGMVTRTGKEAEGLAIYVPQQ
jgi:uncharacterized protein YbjQ (UPF0145 family)